MEPSYTIVADRLTPAAASLPDPPYSAFADWLSKFHTASEPIQAL